MKFRSMMLIAVLLIAGAAMSARAQGVVMSWTVDGVQRQALVFAPPDAKKGKHPLVFGWHGHGGNMHGISNVMGLQNEWKEAIVVYPQGLKTPNPKDPDGQKFGWQPQAGDDNDRDLKFFDQMLSGLHQSFGIDDDRVYSVGFSNGSMFTYVLWSERAKTFAAFGICAGKLMPNDHLQTARPAIIIGGTNDQTVLFPLQQQAIDTVKQLDQATGAGQSCGPICTNFASPTHDPVQTRIHSGGHVYPPWAGGAMVDFLKLHKLP
jgi:polyhydroxybutyrate depolymerase